MSQAGLTKRAALGLPNVIDEDTLDLDFGKDVEAGVDALYDFELEQELEDEELEGDIAVLEDDLIDDELDDLFLTERSDRIGRRAMAEMSRASMKGGKSKESFGVGYGLGYLQAMRDIGVSDEAVKEAYGGLLKNVGSGILKGTKGAFKLAGSAASGFTGGKSLQGLANEAGSQLRERLGPMAIMSDDEDAPAPGASIEAAEGTLPPLYVEDESGFEEDLDEDLYEEDDLYGDLPVEDRFGAVCRYGFVGQQPRERGRKAAHSSVVESKTHLKNARRSTERPFVEDPGATPKLFSDGKIFDPVYGRVLAVPCPSCTHTPEDKASYGAADSCIVCDSYGAILIPKNDIDEFSSASSYGFLPLLIPLISMGVKAVGKSPKVKEWLASQKSSILERKDEESEDLEEIEDPDDLDEDLEDLEEEAPESEDDYGVVRSLVPPSWWNENFGG